MLAEIFTDIFFGSLLALGTGLFLYGILYLWIVKIRQHKFDRQVRKKLGWRLFRISIIAFLLLYAAWVVQEPRLSEFLPVYLGLSLLFGFVLRELAVGRYRSEEWGLKLNRLRKRILKAKREVQKSKEQG